MNLVMYNDIMFEKEMFAALQKDDLTEEEREQIETAMIQNYASSIEKTNDLLKYRQNLEAFQDACKAEEQRIADRRKSAEKLSEKIKDGITSYMLIKGLDSIKAGTFNLSLRGSTSVIIDDEKKIDPKFIVVKTVTSVDKALIKATKEEGGIEQGWHLEHRQNLQVK